MQNFFIDFLPPWVETNLQPAFYDLESGTVLQQVARMYAKVNELVGSFDKIAEEFTTLYNYVHDYFDNLDVQDEVNHKLDEMAEDGTLQSLIYQAINVPQGMTLDARRIGRKLFYSGTGGDANPFNMQGGCRIDDTCVAYALWDSLNKYPVSNRIVVMNINTGEIVRYADYSYGWCNSMTYYDGKLYIAERGKEIDGDGHYENNGVIKVLNADTLALVDTITMDFNVNALAQHNGKFYILQEGTNTIYKYDSTLSTLEDTIMLDIDYVNYHQDFCVDTQYIYLLSTQPSNALNIFDVETGERVRSYNIAKYGGLFRIGELQWVDKATDGNMIIGSDVLTYKENIAQFFVINYKKNVDTKNFNAIYGQTLYCNSDNDYYDADGTVGKEFNSINEALNTCINNIIVSGNNKEYGYAYASDIKFCKFMNCTFTEGLWLQYGDYELVDCEVNACVQPSRTDTCLYIRRGNFFLQRVEFDTTTAYCIDDAGESMIKMAQPTFTGYTTSVFKTNHPTSEVFLNNGNGLPYMPRAYGAKFNITNSADLDAYTAGEYAWSTYTTLTEDQRQELITNCNSIEIAYESLNKSCTQTIVFNNKKTNSADYTISDFVESSSGVNIRFAKIIFNINKTRFKITSNTCLTCVDGTWTNVSTPAQNQVITIKTIKFFNKRS